MDHKENDVFIDLMEKYYGQPKPDKMVDTRPDLHYQVGATPDGVENARNHCVVMEKFPVADKPLTKCPPEADPKWRFFWRMGEKPPQTEFKELNAPQVVPKAFPEWEKVMNTWGGLILGTNTNTLTHSILSGRLAYFSCVVLIVCIVLQVLFTQQQRWQRLGSVWLTIRLRN